MSDDRADDDGGTTGSDRVIAMLRDLLSREEGLGDLVERSLVRARDRAREGLEPALRDALDWPTDLAAYEDYLRGFLRWIPQQSDDPAWKVDAPEHRYAKEVSDRLAHFFWLVDQDVHTDGSAIAERSVDFQRWLTSFAREWGSFLDTPESFSPAILQSFLEHAPEYTIQESLLADGTPNLASGWVTFNQFFARELNPGLRPISERDDNRVLTSPADCSYQHTFGIDAASNIPETTVKQTHRYGNIGQLLEGSAYAEAFAGGTFVHYMLPPSAYHRFHLPVAGRIVESFVVSGRVFMQVDLADGKLVSRDAAETGFEFSQTRGVITVDTTGSLAGDLGIVAVVAVGMSHVASVRLNAVVGTEVDKGSELGFFQFGGSDIIVLLQSGLDVRVDTDPEPRQVGSVIARC